MQCSMAQHSAAHSSAPCAECSTAQQPYAERSAATYSASCCWMQHRARLCQAQCEVRAARAGLHPVSACIAQLMLDFLAGMVRKQLPCRQSRARCRLAAACAVAAARLHNSVAQPRCAGHMIGAMQQLSCSCTHGVLNVLWLTHGGFSMCGL